MPSMGNAMYTGWNSMIYRRTFNRREVEIGSLKRVLTKWDLTALGVGSTMCLGMYVIIGYVAKEIAGPSIVISFVIAAIAALLPALCYCELASSIPKAGSAFIYTYVCIGEFMAFLVGWCLILEYVIATASIARGMSLYFDELVGNTIAPFFHRIAPINENFLSDYFDFFAALVLFATGVAIAFWLKCSSHINKLLVFINIVVVFLIMFIGSFRAKPENWKATPADNVDGGKGGFFPYGYMGTFKGAAVCFYGYTGFESIAATGEESINPGMDIPVAILLTMWIAFVGYFIVSTIITMMIPYFQQSTFSPLPHAFRALGMKFPSGLLATTAVLGLYASLYSTLYPLPRVMFAMAREEVLFSVYGQQASNWSPVLATLIAASVAALLSGLLAMETLITLMSLGTLMAYCLVSACLLLLRYRTDIYVMHPEAENAYGSGAPAPSLQSTPRGTPRITPRTSFSPAPQRGSSRVTPRSSVRSSQPPPPSADPSCERHPNLTCRCDSADAPRTDARSILTQMYSGGGRESRPTKCSSNIVLWALGAFVLASIMFAIVMAFSPLKLFLGIILAGFIILLAIAIALQPSNPRSTTFRTPMVPWVPLLSIFIMINLMVAIPLNTWMYFLFWILLGIPVYFICIFMYRGFAQPDYTRCPRCQQLYPPLEEEEEEAICDPGSLTCTRSRSSSHVRRQRSENKSSESNRSGASNRTKKSCSCISGKKIDPRSRRGEGDYGNDPYQVNMETIDESQKNNTNCNEKEMQAISSENTKLEASDDKNVDIIEQENISIDFTLDSNVSAIVINETQKSTLRQDSVKEDAIHKINGEILIIEFLDQVLEAEEESYKHKNISEINNMNEVFSMPPTPEPKIGADQNSDVESIESLDIPPTYDVVAIIHREDVPKENSELGDKTIKIEQIDYSQEKDTNREILKDELDDLDETFSKNGIIKKIIEVKNATDKNLSFENFRNRDKILMDNPDSTTRVNSENLQTKIDETKMPLSVNMDDDSTNDSEKPYIPAPPPINEKLFGSPQLKRAHTLVAIPRKTNEVTEENRTRNRTLSGSSYDDSVLVFGSDKRTHFMNKLNSMLQNQKLTPRLSSSKRSVSTSHLTDMNIVHSGESDTPKIIRPKIMLDLNNELLSHYNKPKSKLRSPKIKKEKAKPTFFAGDSEENIRDDSDGDEADNSLSREDLKSKLENIFAAGGSMMFKPRLVTSNPPSPNPVAQDFSSEEAVPSPELSQLKEKTEKNDTLKMQRVKFGAVLDTFRNSMINNSENF